MSRHSSLFLAAALLALLPAGRASAQGEAPVFEIDPRPKTFVTDFTWYKTNREANGSLSRSGLGCARATPRFARAQITSFDYYDPAGYYARKYRRFAQHGVDGVAFLVTDRIPTSFSGANLESVARFAAEAGLEVMAYYDLLVTTGRESGLVFCPQGGRECQPNGIKDYDLARYPEIRAQLIEDFVRIAQYLVLPNLDARPGRGYAMLEDALGQRVLDEVGLPRPLIAIYIAREFSDRSASLAELEGLLEEVTLTYRALGLGKPALVIDVLYWGTRSEDDLTKSYDPEIVEAFGDHAVAAAWYGFFDLYRAMRFNIANDRRKAPIPLWAKRLDRHYRKVRRELSQNGHPLMVWPSATPQVDTRPPEHPDCAADKVEVVFHARSGEDWRKMLTRMQGNASRPVAEGQVPLQTAVFISNAGEWFELGGIDDTDPDASGECSYPYNWCGELLDVLAEEDRY